MDNNSAGEKVKKDHVNFYLIRGLGYWKSDRVSKKDRKDQYLHEIG